MYRQGKCTVLALICVFIIVATFAGCAINIFNPPVTHETPLISVTSTVLETPAPLPSMAITNTIVIPSVAASKTPLPTSLPALPTLSPDTAKARILGLLKDNGKCQLPCIWGINPAESTLQSVIRFTEQFGRSSKPGEYDISASGFISAVFWQGNLRASLRFSPSAQKAKLAYLKLYAEFTKEQGRAENLRIHPVFGDRYFDQLFKTLLLPEILSEYGSPSQVIIYPFFDDPDAPQFSSLFSLVLIYHEQGFFIEYLLPKELDAAHYIGCPSKTGYLSLITWDPQNKPTLEEIVGRNGGLGINSNNLKVFKPLEEATSMTSDTFLNTFKNENNKNCITTSQKLWKNPFLSN